LPGVGQNLSEHPNMLLMYKAKKPDTFLNQLRLDRAVGSGARWHRVAAMLAHQADRRSAPNSCSATCRHWADWPLLTQSGHSS